MSEITISSINTPLSPDADYVLSVLAANRRKALAERQEYMTEYNKFYNGVMPGQNQQGQQVLGPGQAMNPKIVAKRLELLGVHAAEYLLLAEKWRTFVNAIVQPDEQVPGCPVGFRFNLTADGSVTFQQGVQSPADTNGNIQVTWQDV